MCFFNILHNHKIWRFKSLSFDEYQYNPHKDGNKNIIYNMYTLQMHKLSLNIEKNYVENRRTLQTYFK